MTQATVFRDGRVLPKKWAPLFRVTFVAGFIETGFDEQTWPPGVVRIVALTAAHRAETHWMYGGAKKLCPLFAMAAIASLRLLVSVQHGILRSVDGVTMRAGDFVLLMRASLPTHSRMIVVALKTHLVLLLMRGSGFFPEVQNCEQAQRKACYRSA